MKAYLKFPPESTDSIFFSWRLGFAPPVNLNLQMLTSVAELFVLSVGIGGIKIADLFLFAGIFVEFSV